MNEDEPGQNQTPPLEEGGVALASPSAAESTQSVTPVPVRPDNTGVGVSEEQSDASTNEPRLTGSAEVHDGRTPEEEAELTTLGSEVVEKLVAGPVEHTEHLATSVNGSAPASTKPIDHTEAAPVAKVDGDSAVVSAPVPQESLTPDVPRAAAILEQIGDEEIQMSFKNRLSKIGVLRTSQESRTIDRAVRVERPMEAPSNSVVDERAAGFQSRIARRLVDAHKAVAAKLGENSQQSYRTEAFVWREALDSAFDDLERDQATIEQAEVEQRITEILVLTELVNGVSEQSNPLMPRTVCRLVELGQVENLIRASRNADGLAIESSRDSIIRGSTTYFEGDSVESLDEAHVEDQTFIPLSRSIESSLPGIEVGLGVTLSLDPASEMRGEQIQNPPIEELGFSNAVLAGVCLAKEAAKNGEQVDHEKMTRLSHTALSRFTGYDQGEGASRLPSIEKGLLLNSLATANPDVIGPEYANDFAQLRAARDVNSHYRSNAIDGSQLDTEIATICAIGSHELAARLISASEKEIVDGAYSGALMYGVIHLSNDAILDEPKLRAELEQLHATKVEQVAAKLHTALESLTLTDRQQTKLESLVTGSNDPESALEVLDPLLESLRTNDDPEAIDSIFAILSTDNNGETVLDGLLPKIMKYETPEREAILQHEKMQVLLDSRLRIEQRVGILVDPELQSIYARLENHPVFAELKNGHRRVDISMRELFDYPERAKQYMLAADVLENSPVTSLLGPVAIDRLLMSVVSKDRSAVLFAAELHQAEQEHHLFSELSLAQVDSLLEILRSPFNGDLTGPQEAVQKMQIIKETGALDVLGAVSDVHTNSALFTQLMRSKEVEKLGREYVAVNTETEFFRLISSEGAAAQHSYALFSILAKSENPVETAKNVCAIAEETNFFDLVGEQGAAYSLSTTLMSMVAAAEDPFGTAKNISDTLINGDPLWLRLYKIAQIGVGEVDTKGFQAGMKVTEVPMALPAPGLTKEQSEQQAKAGLKQFADMTIEEKRMVAQLDGVSDEVVAGLTSIDFDQLTPDFQKGLFAYRLFETITLSRDEAAQQEASIRNYMMAEQGTWLKEGDLIHSTGSVGTLRKILLSGALCGEALGFEAAEDSYPFNLDTVAVDQEVLSAATHQEQVAKLDAQSYGGIAVVFRRGSDALHRGEEFRANGGIRQHMLVMGGLPSTEIASIQLRRDTAPEDVASIKQSLVEHDQYIPLVGLDGTLLLSYEDWKAARHDKKIDEIEIEVVDTVFERPNSQSGSNDGGEFIVPSGEGQPPTRYYVKFGDANPDHIWTELLADSIYRAVKPELVPETRAVMVEGRFARASRIVEADSEMTDEARAEGFVLDCLLANWDAVYNPNNLIMHGSHALRIDTGGSLDFRARGGKKGDAGAQEGEVGFEETVPEIRTGIDGQLGTGMRQQYPGLTDEQIRGQVADMRTQLTDEVIDRLVDGVRRSSADREMLKRILKARRDYIIAAFEAPTPVAA